MSYIPRWATMPKWKLKLMDMLTPAAGVQERVDRLLLYDPKELSVEIRDKAVFIRRNVMFIPQPHPERFPLSKLRKDQLDKIHEIMEKQQSCSPAQPSTSAVPFERFTPRYG